MKKLALATAALALLALPALAKPPVEVRWGRSWDEAVKEAKARNVPIMLGLHKDG